MSDTVITVSLIETYTFIADGKGENMHIPDDEQAQSRRGWCIGYTT